MDKHASVNGLRDATQWIGRRDSMDRTRHGNGLTNTGPSGAAKRTSGAADLCQALTEGNEVYAFDEPLSLERIDRPDAAVELTVVQVF